MFIVYSNRNETLITTKEAEESVIQSDDWFGPYSSRFIGDYERTEWDVKVMRITTRYGMDTIDLDESLLK